MIGQTRISLAAWLATVLGAIVLVPVFSGPFLVLSMFVCGAVTGTGIALQRLRAPHALVPVIQLVVLAEMLSLFFFASTLRFVVVPWKETAIAFNGELVKALDGIQKFSAPLPPEQYFTLFAASVIGLAGLLVHLIAVQLKQAAWSGLLLLSMYTVPAATVHGGLPAVLFVPPAIGYIVLLAAEGRSRLSRWGRRIGGVTAMQANSPVEASAVGQAGRRIGLTVIAIAALLPALLPNLPEGVLANGLSGTGPGTGGGGSSVSLSNPMLDMARNLRRGDNNVVLRYNGPGPVYLRMSTLDKFDGRKWEGVPRTGVTEVDGVFSPPPGLTNQSLDEIGQKRYDIHAERSLRSAWVPVPYPARSVSISGKWRYDPNTLEVLSASSRTIAGIKYSVTAYDTQPSEADLLGAPDSAPPDEATIEVPRSVGPRIGRLAREVTAAADGNRYRQAALLQDYFRNTGRFTYDLRTAPGNGIRALETFLFDDKRGYCEQFATGMALMARTLGIPARVSVGFLPGQAVEEGKYVVRTHDLHAWPELYFEGSGWVRFEPTPSLPSAQPPDYTIPNPDNQPGDDPSVSPSETPSAQPTDPLGSPPDDTGRNLPDEEAGTPGGSTGGWWNTPLARWTAGAVAVLLLALVPWLVRTLVRRRRFSRAAGPLGVEGLWAEIRDTARDLGLDWSESATPRQSGAWLGRKIPADTRPAATRLARAVESSRYATAATPENRGPDLRGDAAVVRNALIAGATTRNRWRARLLPASWRWYLSRGTAEASDLLDQFDLGLARLRSLVLQRRSN